MRKDILFNIVELRNKGTCFIVKVLHFISMNAQCMSEKKTEISYKNMENTIKIKVFIYSNGHRHNK